MKNILKTNALKGVLLVGMLFASAAFCEVSYGSLTDTRDGKSYKTVRIGTQTWMAENLNYAYSEGTARSYCYEDDPANCEKYGRLYTWAAAMDSAAVFGDGGKGCGTDAECTPAYHARGVCPEGWHLPSDAEWMTLEEFVAFSLGERGSVGYALKSASGWESDNGKSGNGSDAFGFGALPAGGYCVDYVGWDLSEKRSFFCNILNGAYFWKARKEDDFCLLGKRGSCSYFHKGAAYSVRCVKD